MVNKEAAAVLVEYCQHIAHYANIADVTQKKETVLTRAARNHAWRLLSKLIPFAEAAKESDLYWLLLEKADTAKESHRLSSIAKHEDRNFMDAKKGLADLLKEIKTVERKDPTGKKRQAELDQAAMQRAENDARHEAEKKEAARQRREARKLEKLAATGVVAKATAKKGTAKKAVKA